jgi:hypothetical protein|tara:strand:- start:728 stop:979 length:252 start_codon:yes stop_codon:yes gene_type:complete
MPILGLEVKTPFDETLVKIFRKRRRKLSRVEKAYFIQLMNRSGLNLMDFNGLLVEPNDFDIKVRKKFTKKTFFDWNHSNARSN